MRNLRQNYLLRTIWCFLLLIPQYTKIDLSNVTVSQAKESQEAELGSPVDSIIMCWFTLGHLRLSVQTCTNVPSTCGQDESNTESLVLPSDWVPYFCFLAGWEITFHTGALWMHINWYQLLSSSSDDCACLPQTNPQMSQLHATGLTEGTHIQGYRLKPRASGSKGPGFKFSFCCFYICDHEKVDLPF